MIDSTQPPTHQTHADGDQRTTRANAPTLASALSTWMHGPSRRACKTPTAELDKMKNYFSFVTVTSVGFASGRVFSRYVQDASGVDIGKMHVAMRGTSAPVSHSCAVQVSWCAPAHFQPPCQSANISLDPTLTTRISWRALSLEVWLVLRVEPLRWMKLMLMAVV